MVYLFVGLAIGFLIGFIVGWRKGSYNERVEMVRLSLRNRRAS